MKLCLRLFFSAECDDFQTVKSLIVTHVKGCIKNTLRLISTYSDGNFHKERRKRKTTELNHNLFSCPVLCFQVHKSGF
jgi:hypothetical protein